MTDYKGTYDKDSRSVFRNNSKYNDIDYCGKCGQFLPQKSKFIPKNKTTKVEVITCLKCGKDRKFDRPIDYKHRKLTESKKKLWTGYKR